MRMPVAVGTEKDVIFTPPPHLDDGLGLPLKNSGHVSQALPGVSVATLTHTHICYLHMGLNNPPTPSDPQAYLYVGLGPILSPTHVCGR